MIEIRLKKLIQSSKLKERPLREIAKKIGISHVALWRLMNKGTEFNPSLDMINKLCIAFDCDPGDFIVRRKDTRTKTSKIKDLLDDPNHSNDPDDFIRFWEYQIGKRRTKAIFDILNRLDDKVLEETDSLFGIDWHQCSAGLVEIYNAKKSNTGCIQKDIKVLENILVNLGYPTNDMKESQQFRYPLGLDRRGRLLKASKFIVDERKEMLIELGVAEGKRKGRPKNRAFLFYCCKLIDELRKYEQEVTPQMIKDYHKYKQCYVDYKQEDNVGNVADILIEILQYLCPSKKGDEYRIPLARHKLISSYTRYNLGGPL